MHVVIVRLTSWKHNNRNSIINKINIQFKIIVGLLIVNIYLYNHWIITFIMMMLRINN